MFLNIISFVITFNLLITFILVDSVNSFSRSHFTIVIVIVLVVIVSIINVGGCDVIYD